MAQIFRTDNPLFGKGLKLGQRLCYLSAPCCTFLRFAAFILDRTLAYLFLVRKFSMPPA